MNVFYNREGIGDVLLVSLKPIPAEERAFVKRGDVVRIFSERRDGRLQHFFRFFIPSVFRKRPARCR